MSNTSIITKMKLAVGAEPLYKAGQEAVATDNGGDPFKETREAFLSAGRVAMFFSIWFSFVAPVLMVFYLR